MFGYCRDCKHWFRRDDPFMDHPEPKPPTSSDDLYGFCVLSESTDLTPDNPKTLAYAFHRNRNWSRPVGECCPDPAVSLCTSPDYGCVQFES